MTTERQEHTAEFLNSLTANDEMVKPVMNPEAWIMREKMRGAANRGALMKTQCTHPLAHIRQFEDDDPTAKRHSKPVNLFECGVCHYLLWFVDAWGEPIGDD